MRNRLGRMLAIEDADMRSFSMDPQPVYLTFDDGPDPEWTPRILDVLARAEMTATFFAIGTQAKRSPDLLLRIRREGHTIGNHSFSHKHPWWMNERSARAEVREGTKALSDLLGHLPTLFRPPHGRTRACMVDEAKQHGQRTVLWNLSAVDWGPFGKSHRIERRLSRIEPEHIVLMHDGRNQHNRPDQLCAVLPEVLKGLRGRGLQSRAIS